jgi:AcrR family transcriptional regulator
MDKVQTEDRSPGPGAPETLEGPDRPRREPLTRERIIQAALRIMDEEGLEAVTMRRIGRDLGVEAMSLYNHVQDKEDILDGMCEHVLSQFRIPQVEGWVEAARLGAREFRRLLLDHPNVIRLMTDRKSAFTNAESLRGYEFALDVFRSAGLSEADSVKAFHAFGGYIFGFVMMELGLMVGGPEDEEHVRAHEEMARILSSADLPRLRESLPYLINCDVEEQFEFGLDLLIQGIRARIAATG